MIGQTISPLLEEMEEALWTHEAESNGGLPGFTDKGFRAAIKVFSSAMLERMRLLMDKEGVEGRDRDNMILRSAMELRSYVKTFADIDLHKLYKK